MSIEYSSSRIKTCIGKISFVLAVTMMFATVMLAGCGAKKEKEVVRVNWTKEAQQDGADTPGKYVTYAYQTGDTVFDESSPAADSVLNVSVDLSEGGTGIVNMVGADISVSWKDGDLWYDTYVGQGEPLYRYIQHEDEMVLIAYGDMAVYFLHKDGSDSKNAIKLYNMKDDTEN